MFVFAKVVSTFLLYKYKTQVFMLPYSFSLKARHLVALYGLPNGLGIFDAVGEPQYAINSSFLLLQSK